jgi:hypothetical protein
VNKGKKERKGQGIVAQTPLALNLKGAGLAYLEALRESPQYSQVHHPEYTLPRSSVLNRRKPLVKDG